MQEHVQCDLVPFYCAAGIFGDGYEASLSKANTVQHMWRNFFSTCAVRFSEKHNLAAGHKGRMELAGRILALLPKLPPELCSSWLQPGLIIDKDGGQELVLDRRNLRLRMGEESKIRAAVLDQVPDAAELLLLKLCLVLGLAASLPNLKKLTIDSLPDSWPENRNKIIGEHLAWLLRTNATLQELTLRGIELTADGAEHLFIALCEASSAPLKSLELISLKNVGGEVANRLGNMLSWNLFLEKLVVRSCGMEDSGGDLAIGLKKNSTLKELWISGNKLGKAGLEPLFTHLAILKEESPLRLLDISHDKGDLPSVGTLETMLSKNQSLRHLQIRGASYDEKEWTDVILPAVENNRWLQSISVGYCNGIAGDTVLEKLLSVASCRINTVLQEFDLSGTPLEVSGKAATAQEAFRVKKDFKAALWALPKSQAKSCRVFLCGKEHAGKSTLFRTMIRREERRRREQQQNSATCSGWIKNVTRAVESFWERHVRCNPSCNQGGRTRGIDIRLLTDEPRITLWNFAGQKEFHALHFFMFPNGDNAASLFVLTWSPMVRLSERGRGKGKVKVKTKEQLEADLLYWLKSIASNSKRNASTLPSVVVVITNRDRLEKQKGYAAALDIYKSAVREFATQFNGLVHMSEETFVVNALAEEEDAIEKFETNWREILEETLKTLPQEPTICNWVLQALGKEQTSSPIISTHDFETLCRKFEAQQEDPTVSEEVKNFLDSGSQSWTAIAAYLHNAGEVIYHKDLNFIIKDPMWFVHRILGHLIDLFPKDEEEGCACFQKKFFKRCCSMHEKSLTESTKKGLMNRQVLKDLLERALQEQEQDATLLTCLWSRATTRAKAHSVGSTQQQQPQNTVISDFLIDLMLLLDLCYEKEPGNEHKDYLLPAMFEDKGNKAANGQRPLEWKKNEDLIARGDSIFVGLRLQRADPVRTFLTNDFFPRLQVVLHNHALAEKWIKDADKQNLSLEKNLISIQVNNIQILVEYSGASDYFVDILVNSQKGFQETLDFVRLQIIGTIRAFCSSHEGCQGVDLHEAIIRPGCVEGVLGHPTLCAYRQNQAILVDVLKGKVTTNKSYQHKWPECRTVAGARLVLGKGESDGEFLLTGKYSDGYAQGIMDRDSRHIFVSSEDVGQLRQMGAKIRIGGALPFRFHLQCQCRHAEHMVDNQPGRIFYVVDEKFELESNARNWIMKIASAVLKIGGDTGFVPFLGLAGEVVPQFKGTPVYYDTIEALGLPKITKATEKEEEVRKKVEEDLQACFAGAWMNAFLNRDLGLRAFRQDFRLSKVEYISPHTTKADKRRAWLCDQHVAEGLRNNILRKVI